MQGQKSRVSVSRILGINLLILVMLVLLAEIFLRLTGMGVDYYATVDREGKISAPYGDVVINSWGYPDEEFDLNDARPRVGYFGDSVTHGLGAGFGYRFTDFLRLRDDRYQHFNLALIGINLYGIRTTYSRIAREDFDLDRVIVFFNLNDIGDYEPIPQTLTPEELATVNEKAPVNSTFNKLRRFSLKRLQGLQRNSRVYVYLRSVFAQAVAMSGMRNDGTPVFELYPEKYSALVASTAGFLNRFAQVVERDGREFCLVLLPYEMQISAEAEETYRALGISWEDGFVAGSTQAALRAHLDPAVAVADATEAFVDPAAPEVSRHTNVQGEYFVNDRGGRLDWNHLNREGHARLAEWLSTNRVCGINAGT